MHFVDLRVPPRTSVQIRTRQLARPLRFEQKVAQSIHPRIAARSRGTSPPMGLSHGIVAATVLRAVVFLVFTALGYCQAGEQQGVPELNHEFVHKSVESVAATVDREYFDAAIAAQVASSLRKRLADGGYGEVKTLKSLAEKLTQDIPSVPPVASMEWRAMQINGSRVRLMSSIR